MATRTKQKKNEKIDFSDSIKAIKGTAKNLNEHMKEFSEEFMEDIKENTGQIREKAMKPVKEVYNSAYEKVVDTVSLENLSKTTKKLNNYTLKTAEELVEGVLVNGEKWQHIADKAIKGSLKLTAKQQVIVFETLETMKNQMTDSADRFKKLFSNN